MKGVICLAALSIVPPVWGQANRVIAPRPAASAPANFRPLAPLDLETVKGIGRHILAAKQGQGSDPVQRALTAELTALRVDIDQAITELAERFKPRLQVSPTGRKLTASVSGPVRAASLSEIDAATVAAGTGAAQTSGTTVAAAPALSAALASRLRSRQAAIAGRRTQLEMATSSMGETRTPGLTAGMAVAAATIETDLGKALAANDAGQMSLLIGLRERLRTKNQAEVADERRRALAAEGSGVQPPIESTPTITTITQHR